MRKSDLEITQSYKKLTEPPNLIFSETHDDPAVKIILLKMLKKLIDFGYTSFYDEVSEIETSNQVIENLKAFEHWFSDLMEKTMSKLDNDQIPSYLELKEIYKENERGGVHIFDIDEMGDDKVVEMIINVINKHEKLIQNTEKKHIEKSPKLSKTLFFSKKGLETIPINKWVHGTDVSNFLFDKNYDPSTVSNVIKLVLNNNNIEKL